MLAKTICVTCRISYICKRQISWRFQRTSSPFGEIGKPKTVRRIVEALAFPYITVQHLEKQPRTNTISTEEPARSWRIWVNRTEKILNSRCISRIKKKSIAPKQKMFQNKKQFVTNWESSEKFRQPTLFSVLWIILKNRTLGFPFDSAKKVVLD